MIDGASTDGSVDIIEQYADKIDYWVSEPDTGIYNAMNKGIDQAYGEYLLFLNSGDWFYNNIVLDKFICSQPREDILYGTSIFIKDGKIIHKKVYPHSLDGMELMYWTLNHQCIFFHSSLFSEGKNYNTHYKLLADWAFYMDAIFFENKTYRRLNFEVVYYDYTGFSSIEENREKLKAEKMNYYIDNADYFVPHFLKEYDILKGKVEESRRRKERRIFFRIKRKLSSWI